MGKKCELVNKLEIICPASGHIVSSSHYRQCSSLLRALIWIHWYISNLINRSTSLPVSGTKSEHSPGSVWLSMSIQADHEMHCLASLAKQTREWCIDQLAYQLERFYLFAVSVIHSQGVFSLFQTWRMAQLPRKQWLSLWHEWEVRPLHNLWV